jgi:hypothetical protein
MSPSAESLTYQYLILMIHWGGKELYRFRIYDSEKRMADRISPLINKSVYKKEELEEIIKVATEELNKHV